MELEGSLKAFSLPEILQFLAMSKMTGALSVKKPDYDLELIIRHGRIVNSNTFERRSKVGQILVYRGVIQRQQLQEALNYQKAQAPEKRLGELLIERGLVSAESLTQMLKLQLEEEVWNLFDSADGDFKFEHIEPEKITAKHLEIDIEPLIIEGTRRLDEWSRISQEIESDDLVLAVNPLPENWERDVTLTENEWRILAMVNGFYTVESLIRRSCLGKFETCRILFTLLNAGIIHVREPAEVPPAPAVKESAAPEQPKPAAARAEPRGLGRFLGFGQAPESEASSNTPALSPLGAGCELVNRYFETCANQRDFGGIESNLIDTLWRECLNLYPHADLIFGRGNRLVYQEMERYLDLCGASVAGQACYEDGIEALEHILGRLYALSSQRLSEKQARRLLTGLPEALPINTAARPVLEDFSLEQLIGRILPAAEGEAPNAR